MYLLHITEENHPPAIAPWKWCVCYGEVECLFFKNHQYFFNNDSLLKTLMNAMAYRIHMSQTIYYILCLYCIFFQWINDSCLCFLLLWQLSEFMLYGPLSNNWYGPLLCTQKCPLHLRRLTGSQPTNEGQRWVFYYFKGSFQVHWVKR